MEKIETEYSDTRIIYWPSYEAGKIGIVFFSVLGAMFIAISLWTLLDNITIGTQLEIIVAIPVVVIAWWISCKFILRKMYVKIVVSNTGIVYSNNYTKEEKQISWGEISAVYFSQEHWHGRKSCRIYLKKAAPQPPREKESCDFVLPVASVDEKKFLQFIPNYLWTNDPWRC